MFKCKACQQPIPNADILGFMKGQETGIRQHLTFVRGGPSLKKRPLRIAWLCKLCCEVT